MGFRVTVVFPERQHLNMENIWGQTMEIIHLNVTSVLDLSSNFNMLNAMNMFDCSSLHSELYFLLLTVAKIHPCLL